MASVCDVNRRIYRGGATGARGARGAGAVCCSGSTFVPDCLTAYLLVCFAYFQFPFFYFFVLLFASSELATYDFPSRQKEPKKKEGEGQPDTRKRVTPPSSVLTFTALIKCAAPRPSLYLLQLKKLLKLVV